jgi:CRISPR-associated protein (TIGR03986 family)
MQTFSARVKSKERAGRAPYNFVPLPEKLRTVEGPPPGDRYGEELVTGEIHLTLTAKTKFYTRGMWPLAEFQGQTKEKQNPDPFQVGKKLRLPGSSIRGMVRNLVEILSGSPLEPINNTRLFFRSVAAVADPRNISSFEPQAHEYKGRMLDQNRELKVQAGYIYTHWDEESKRVVWEILPATSDPETGRQWYRYRTFDKWLRKEVRFNPNGDFAIVTPLGRERGWLVCSGPMPRKTKQWVVREEDPAATPLTIDSDLVHAYKDNGVTRDLKGRFEYNDRTVGMPCFYTLDKDNKVTGFGHTAWFRMAYRNGPQNAMPRELRKYEKDWDFAQALSGRTTNRDRDGARSRVFFEDGFHSGGPEHAGAEVSVVQGQPKPTTYQHYLVQPSEQLDQIKHWDGDYLSQGTPVLRGHKLYWHRPGVPLPEVDPSKENVISKMRPGPEGATFTARVRFENLRKEELGALITALELPKGCAHHLGMGKPLGLGSFLIEMPQVLLMNPETRYGSFLTREGLALNDGLRPATPEERVEFQNAFADWYQKGLKGSQLWGLKRFQELRALLTYGPAQATERWWNITRYLEFGSPDDYRGVSNYNEYNQVGYPDGRPTPQKRRPLPPATQVLGAGDEIPDDKRPRFVKRAGR